MNKQSLSDIRNRIAAISPSAQLLAVSKKQSVDAIRSVYEKGIHQFGENFVQEALEKMPALLDCDIAWHFIGPIQSNKTRAIAENFSWVHSVDRLKIAERLNTQRPSQLGLLNICVQINIDEEETKSGILPGELMGFLTACQSHSSLKVRGLMCIPKPRENVEEQRAVFQQMRALFDAANQQGFSLDTLSMGMSADFETAIECGATIVRLGRVLFGERY